MPTTCPHPARPPRRRQVIVILDLDWPYKRQIDVYHGIIVQFTYMDLQARFIVEACKQRGLRVPEDVAVIGSGNEVPLCLEPAPTLTSVDHGYFNVGIRSAELLASLIDGKEPPSAPVMLSEAIQLIARQSTDSFAVDDPLLVSALRYISENCHQPINVDDVVRNVPASRRSLERRFAQALNRSIADEMCRLRVRRLERLLVVGDKRMVFGRVDILEQSPARVLIRWRYPLSNVGYQVFADGWADDSGWGEWCDWYFTIYPDGSCVKRMRSWMSVSHGREWHESMVILGPGQHPEQVIETKPALTLATLAGAVRTYDWIDAPPEQVDYSEAAVHVVNLRGEFDPYSICRVDSGNVYQKRAAMPYSVFPAWNHWPVGQMPSCGRYALYPDRAAHSSLTHLYWANSVNFGEQGAFEEKLLLDGLGRGPVGTIIDLARSYLEPPSAEAAGGGFKAAFDANTRAYSILRDSGEVREMTVVLGATAARPAVNPVFTVENWGADQPAKLTIGGKPPARDLDIRQGVVRRANGVNALVIWIETTCREATSFGIGM